MADSNRDDPSPPPAGLPVVVDPPPEEPHGPGALRHLLNRIVGGIFVILPLMLTLVLLTYVYKAVDVVMGPAATWFVSIWSTQVDEFPTEDSLLYQIIVGSIAVVLSALTLYIIGMLADTQLRRLFDQIITRLPIINRVYLTIYDIVEKLRGGGMGRKGLFERVCFFKLFGDVEVMGFVTGHTMGQDGKVYVSVYTPTPPNPTSGFLYLLPPEQVRIVDWSGDQSVQTIMSCGLLMPQRVRLRSVDLDHDTPQDPPPGYVAPRDATPFATETQRQPGDDEKPPER